MKRFIFACVLVFCLFFVKEVYPVEYITDANWGGGNFVLSDGDSIAGVHSNIDTFLIPTGVEVGVKSYDGSNYGSLTVQANTIIIEGVLSGNGKGYPPSEGPGAGADGNPLNGSGAGGGGYGGEGGDGEDGSTYPGGSVYGDSAFGNEGTYDWEMGSGGGNAGNYLGGSGGGKVKLNGEEIIIEGQISVDGLPGESGEGNCAAGGGSGGSIWIIGDSIVIQGSLTARGGNGGAENPVNGGGGGGGRVHIKYREIHFSGRIEVSGGEGVWSATEGQNGTVYIQPNTEKNTEIYLTGGDPSFGTHSSREGKVKAQFDSLSVVVSAGDSIVGNVVINAKQNITINSGGLISANGKGYASSEGPSAGADGDPLNGSGAGGGGYGGEGGGGEDGIPGGSSYWGGFSEYCDPQNYGSGGGNAYYFYFYPGGSGGGKIRLVANTVRIDGIITAEGEDGTGGQGNYASGGGSGGSVWIEAINITGSGYIYANGGDGGSGNGSSGPYGGGGGGGRVVLLVPSYGEITYDTGNVEVNGGIGLGTAQNGQVGSTAWSKEALGRWMNCLYWESKVERRQSFITKKTHLPSAITLSLFPTPERVLIKFTLSKTTLVELKIFSLTGKLIKTLINQKLPPDIYYLKWDKKDKSCKKVKKGIYFCTLKTKFYFVSKKFILF